MTHSTLRVWGVVVGAVVGAALAVGFAWALSHESYNVWGAVVVVPLVVAANGVIIWRVCVRENDRFFTAIFVTGFVAKLLATLGRYFVAYVVYDGAADAERYNVYAAAHYALWRDGTITWEWGGKQGTQYMELITTAVYTVIGPSPLGGFFVYSSLAFWGAYLLYRAFRIAVPDGDWRRYSALVFLLPSMLYWPSSIGKEAWLLLFVGVTALGAAKYFAQQWGALLLLAGGALGTAIIRPHVAVLLFAALLVAQLFRPVDKRSTGFVTKVLGLVVMGVAAVVLTTQSARFLGIDDFNWQAISESVGVASGQASQGGSAFAGAPITSPLGIPAAVVTVLFRPFPWEAHNIQLVLQSLEGLVLLVLLLRSWPRLRGLPRAMRRNPYVTFAVVYVGAFIWAFSGFGNFGILARQRVLMIPFFLILLALPKTRKGVPEEEEPEREL
ncbi:MAG TPA: hypothetical protein VFN34_12925, partial [Ornithinibacter sp.]|nr:hypothetical protein [Ornithinibacter sp.]